MFKRLNDAYDYLISSIREYADSFRDSARRMRELNGLDDPAPLPTLPAATAVEPTVAEVQTSVPAIEPPAATAETKDAATETTPPTPKRPVNGMTNTTSSVRFSGHTFGQISCSLSGRNNFLHAGDS